MDVTQDKARFSQHKWSQWRLDQEPHFQFSTDSETITVDSSYSGDLITYGDYHGKAREPFFGSILNIFLRIVSTFIPANETKYAYLIEFPALGKINLFIAEDTWSSHAEILCYNNSKDLPHLARIAKEYIRHRCFVDGIQPLES